MDFSHTYLTTLRISAISETLRNKYGLSFNKEKFVRIGKDLNIRGETMIGEQYKFTPAGNTFVNYAGAGFGETEYCHFEPHAWAEFARRH